MRTLVKMLKILPSKNFLSRRGSIGYLRPEAILIRLFSVDKEKDKEEFEIEEKYKVQQGVLHDKQQSVQEESFFHKETKEQLKALKEKVKKDAEKGSDTKKN